MSDTVRLQDSKRPALQATRWLGLLLAATLAQAGATAALAQVGGTATLAQDRLPGFAPTETWEPAGEYAFDRVGQRPWVGANDVPRSAPPEKIALADRISALTRGRVQIEGGYAFVYDAAEGSRVTEHTVPDLLLRVGLTERLELRIGWPGYVSTRYEGRLAADSTGRTLDPNVGFMFDLWPQQGPIPQTAVLAAVPITLEGDPTVMNSLQPLSELLYCWYLSDRLALGGTTGVALFRDDGDDFIQFQQSINLDVLLHDRLSTFAEWQLFADHGSVDDGPQHLLSAGLSWLWTDRFQVSWRAGGGLNDRAPDLLTDLRFALRF
jgi:hypothetical protein